MFRTQFARIILGCIAVSLLSATATAATTIYVDSASQGVEDGTREHPFRTIEPAMDVASVWDTVLVAAGTYTPVAGVLVMKPGVTLMGVDSATTIIKGGVGDSITSNLPISVLQLTLDGFGSTRTVPPGSFEGVCVVRGCTLKYVSFSSPGALDSPAYTAHSYLIEGNTVRDMIAFPQGAGRGTMTIRNNVIGRIELRCGPYWTYHIENNTIRDGIFDAADACWTTVTGNTITDGGYQDASGGIDNEEDAVVSGNTINYSGREIDGDVLEAAVNIKSNSISLVDNTITSAVSGVALRSGPPTNLIGNRISVPILQHPISQRDSSIFAVITSAGSGVVQNNVIVGGYVGYLSSSGAREFTGNTISKAHIGLISSGGEWVAGNTVTDCSGDGMILAGLRGPIERNRVENNAGAGIRVTRYPIDLGGGADTSIGENILRGNGDFDLRLEVSGPDTGTLYARNNYWDHATHEEIAAFDIFDDEDADSLPHVEFTPFAVSGVNDDDESAHLPTMTCAPNPAGTWCRIVYRLDRSAHVSLCLFDIAGIERARIVDEWQSHGEHSVTLTVPGGSLIDLPSGLYYVRLTVGGRSAAESIIVR